MSYEPYERPAHHPPIEALPPIPARHRICIRSRISVGDDESTPPVPNGKIVSLRDREGREALRAEVWGAEPLDVAGLGPIGEAEAHEPRGSYVGVPRIDGPWLGRIVRPETEAPGGKIFMACLLELSIEHGAAVTFACGWCRRLEVLLDDDRTVVIPAGRIHLDSPTRAWANADDSLRGAILAAHEIAPDDPEFPKELARALVASTGDRVAIFGQLREHLEHGGMGAYRTVAATTLMPVLPPLMVVVPGR